MISPVVSGLVYSMKRRTVMEVISPRMRKLWKKWDLRAMVLLSLTLQVLLVILGNRRKYDRKLWVRTFVWFAYLASDFVATCALGVLSNNLGDIYDEDGGPVDANVELTALWAPFLLLHLGGPDTITAYALEDNQLWLRHLLGLIAQTAIAFNVFLMAWTGSYLSVLFIPMFLAGMVKYGERTWVLWSVSNVKHRRFGYPSRVRNTNILQEKKTKEDEGYTMDVEKISEITHQVDLSVLDKNPIPEEDKLLIAYELLDLTKCFLLDATISSFHKATIIFTNMSSQNAFEVIEIQLGMVYDLLYTKAPLVYTPWGLGLRLITFVLTCSVLVIFSFLCHKYKYSKADLSITFLLLIVAIILETYAALVLLFSDRFVIWLCKHKKNSTFHARRRVPPFHKSPTPRWSNKMSQYSFLSFSVKVEPLPCHYVVKVLTIIDENLERRWNISDEEVSVELKDMIFCHLRSIVGGCYQAPSIINDSSYPKFQEELGRSILFWHIVTEVLYHLDHGGAIEKVRKEKQNDADLVQQISRYMLYLLVVHPSLLSSGMNEISIQETFDEAVHILGRQVFTSETEALGRLINRLHADETRQNGSNVDSLLHMAVRIAEGKSGRWREICGVWLEILTYAAKKCKGNDHAKQLKNGGELLTHVWLLMANLGLTDHFTSAETQITRLHGI